MRQTILTTILTHMAVASATQPSPAQETLPMTVMVRELETPADRGSGEPSLTRGQNGQLYLTWVERRPDTSHVLYLSHFDSAGWVPALPVSSGRNWFVNWADFPALAVGQHGMMLASWLQKSGTDTYAYGIRMSRSTTAGQDWQPPFSPHDDNTETEHGFVSLVPLPDDEFGAVWLDGRQMVKPDGPMSLRFAHVDSQGRLKNEQLIDPRICDCCQTSMVRCSDGSLVVAYRDRSDMEVRDISVVRYIDNRWTEPKPIHADGWHIAGCPVNGPALDAYDRTVVAAWFTMGKTDSAMVNVAYSTDCGATFAAPVRMDLGNPLGRVDVCLVDGTRACVVWLQPMGDKTNIVMRVVAKDGEMTRPFTIAVTSANRESGFPHIAYDGERLIVAWTDPEAGPKIRAAQLLLE